MHAGCSGQAIHRETPEKFLTLVIPRKAPEPPKQAQKLRGLSLQVASQTLTSFRQKGMVFSFPSSKDRLHLHEGS